ncbi:MAG: cation-translocating P-type ATPase, partial [Planctomycetia bacterium]
MRHAWHALPVATVAATLGADTVAGLSAAEAAHRLERDGTNTFIEPPPVPLWRRVARQFGELMIWILIAAALIAAALGEWADTTAITAIVLVNAFIGFFQEERATRAIEALAKLSAPMARVIRDGGRGLTPARDIVPGDRIMLEAGDRVPADARLVESHALRVQEAALTGESEPVEKHADAIVADDAPLGDRATILHSGTVVAGGRGDAIVVATGMATELGRIAGLLQRAPAQATPLQRRLTELGHVLIVICLAIVTVIVGFEIRRGGSLWDVSLLAVSLAVAAVPEGLPAVVTLVLAIGLQRMVARNALVRRLPSVETLGSVTVVCSDKTGTLTRNEMTVREIVAGGRTYRVTGTGYAPHGDFLAESDSGIAVDAAADADLRRLLVIAATCTNASIEPGGDAAWRVIGDPTEGALVVAALKAGVARDESSERLLFEIPFDPERTTMSVVVERPDGTHVMYSKGAPEAILRGCTAEQSEGMIVPLTDERRMAILETAGTMARRAMRVLALAWRHHPPRVGAGRGAAAPEDDLGVSRRGARSDAPRDAARGAGGR